MVCLQIYLSPARLRPAFGRLGKKPRLRRGTCVQSLLRLAAEHGADRFFVADAAHRFSHHRGDVQLANARAGLRGSGQRDGVGYHHLVQGGAFDVLDGAAGQHGVGAVGVDTLGDVVLQGLGGMTQGTGGVDHVVDQHAGAALYIADDVHDFRHVKLRATLVDDRQVDAQALGHGTGAHHAADVRGDDQQVVEALVLDVVHQSGRAVDVVHGNVEEALDLVGMQVDGEHAVDAHVGQHVGHHLGADRHAGGTRAAVLAGVAEVGDHGSDARGGGTAEGVGHHHQFHQVVVGGRTGRLDQEDVLAADIFIDFNADLAVGELADGNVAEGDVQLLDDATRQVGVGIPREDHHLGHAQYLPGLGPMKLKSCSKRRAF